MRHVLCDCPRTRKVRKDFDVPRDSRFLRVYLLGLPAKTLDRLI